MSERWIVVLCLGAAIVFVVRAAQVRGGRRWLLVPAAALLVVAVSEFGMDRWEKTVRAPIRLDRMVEIPVAGVFAIWGVLAVVFSGEKKNEKPDTGSSRALNRRAGVGRGVPCPRRDT
jgi:hypothetical protein